MNIREYLFRKEIKKKDFAKRIGVSISHFIRIIKGDNCTRNTMAKIVVLTNNEVTFEDFMTKKDYEEIAKELGVEYNPINNTK